MTLTQALHYAEQITQNDKAALEPLIKLLFAFRASRGDPGGEAMMRAVLMRLYAQTDHCEDFGLAAFVSDDQRVPSIAA